MTGRAQRTHHGTGTGSPPIIKTIADLLHRLALKERDILDQQDITHGPMIGDMFEGLTKDLLERSLPVPGVYVSDGFLVNSEGKMSKQLDCIISLGEGEQIPHTNHAKHAFGDAIAVVEVKKTLHSADIEDSHSKIRSVMDVFQPREAAIGPVRDVWRHMLRTGFPERSELGDLPFWQEMIYHALAVEMIAPARIVLGYHGYSTELAFRESVAGYLQKNIGSSGFGPTSLPDLIVSGQHYLLKSNGYPYAVVVEEDEWPLLLSDSGNPLLPLLEQVWARLAMRVGLPNSAFGEDLTLGSGHPLLFARCVRLEDGRQGWSYRYSAATKEDLTRELTLTQWEPSRLDEAEFTLVNILCKDEVVRLDDPDLANYLGSKGRPLEDVVASLRGKALAYVQGNALHLLTDECVALIDPQLGFLAGENRDGKVVRWLGERLRRSKEGS